MVDTADHVVDKLADLGISIVEQGFEKSGRRARGGCDSHEVSSRLINARALSAFAGFKFDFSACICSIISDVISAVRRR